MLSFYWYLLSTFTLAFHKVVELNDIRPDDYITHLTLLPYLTNAVKISSPIVEERHFHTFQDVALGQLCILDAAVSIPNSEPHWWAPWSNSPPPLPINQSQIFLFVMTAHQWDLARKTLGEQNQSAKSLRSTIPFAPSIAVGFAASPCTPLSASC